MCKPAQPGGGGEGGGMVLNFYIGKCRRINFTNFVLKKTIGKKCCNLKVVLIMFV